MRQLIIQSLIVASCAACGADTSSLDSLAPSASEQAIIGGTTDSGDPGVVAIYMSIGALCSGTLISPTVVLTAAHCVSPDEMGEGVQFVVLPVPNIDNATQDNVLEVASVDWDHAFDINAPEAGHDVGIVTLAQPVTSITPIPFNTTTLTSANRGQNVRIVGYGLSNASRQTGAGTKRQATVALDDFDDMLIQSGTTGKNTCSGDSGGPMLANIGGKETVIGITSFGSYDCTGGGYDTRVDTYASFIKAHLNGTTSTTPTAPADPAPPTTPPSSGHHHHHGGGGG